MRRSRRRERADWVINTARRRLVLKLLARPLRDHRPHSMSIYARTFPTLSKLQRRTLRRSLSFSLFHSAVNMRSAAIRKISLCYSRNVITAVIAIRQSENFLVKFRQGLRRHLIFLNHARPRVPTSKFRDSRSWSQSVRYLTDLMRISVACFV